MDNPNQCGITRSNQYECWPKVKVAALQSVTIPYLTPEERGDSQPYPTDYSHIYNHGPSYIAEQAVRMDDSNADANYVWPGPVAVW